ncbi:tryptophan synthase subunit alpha [candidate division WOR-1 bacterium RIFOXYA12_FULL_43_27]|uniref:Tryptophan synthase alpha chain n=1 Tax=candidate division WOR-1 bacterium RIFOXYC2_FULL_46_14 TaxID=1802587 RepID=A0A1F4U4I8_UNCSA|nr:MAG: tryptophan synthase subunit alpha [candidate division WOR-1 bacterium RIFOXYA12_FULL_43_27]OGC20857.1 MAG: tryptophan synthase subunit alpha [candidate division WOR-1 bacterium RIFOXYB2_FULL_46_45]OGC31405.1 MAG: tryptophan synthase subunit alpha [candidate division WOR-1 bacterium RIFOXYA2_FULL_46_56]OGC39811.1 MAG: tryptophan synthase subunit alpha [candidate division WOR-1 bacterium RIFOXYC2_FULL_46_14]
MSKLSEAFKNKKALITYITAGDPNLGTTEKLVYALEKAGADIVELGIPFSDSLADGPVIQASHLRALKTSLNDVFKLVKKLRKRTRIPIVLMLADNLVVKYGSEKFYLDAEKVGVDGVIIPDLPPDQGVGAGIGVDKILLIAPTTTEERIKMIAEQSSGFIYLVSLAGITGKRKNLSAGLPELVQKIRKYTDKPIAIGFGISNPKQAAAAAKIADGVIVGSAIVGQPLPKVEKFVKSLRHAIDR